MEHTLDRECGEGPRRHIRHILPFLAIPLAIGLMKGVMHHKFGKMSGLRRGMTREGWENGVPPMFAELHRRAHAAEAEKPAETAE